MFLNISVICVWIIILRLRPCRRLPPLVFIDFHWFSLIFLDFHWVFIESSLLFLDFHWNFIDFHRFSLIFKDFKDFHWFSMVFQRQLCQCWTAFGPLGVGIHAWNCCFAWGFRQKQDQCPDPIGSLQRPSAPAGWELRSRTGLPPQTPPDFLF